MKSKFLLLLIMCVLWDAAAAHDIDTKTTNITVGDNTENENGSVYGSDAAILINNPKIESKLVIHGQPKNFS